MTKEQIYTQLQASIKDALDLAWHRMDKAGLIDAELTIGPEFMEQVDKVTTMWFPGEEANG